MDIGPLRMSTTNYFQDCEAYKLHGNEGGWQLAGPVESKSRPGLQNGREESALHMFRQMDLKGKVKDDTKLNTVHQNTITTIRPYEGGSGRVTKFSSKWFQSNLLISLTFQQLVELMAGW